MKIRQLEDMWKEVGWTPSKEWFKGYIIAHFEQIYLGIRDIACVNINLFEKHEGLQLIFRMCQTYNCSIIHVDDGEVWITKKDNLILGYRIPSRFSDKKEDHIQRGRLLGYPEHIINSYFEED